MGKHRKCITLRPLLILPYNDYSSIILQGRSIMKQTRSLFFLAAACTVAFVSACTPSLTPVPGNGTRGSIADANGVVRYVALGNSLTAGFQSNAVVSSEVQYAYPTIIARQLGLTFGDAADQYQYMQFPANGGIGVRTYVREFNAAAAPVITGIPLGNAPSNAALPRPYNNLGVPGIILSDIHPPAIATDPLSGALIQVYNARFAGNPYFPAVMRNPAQLGRTLLDQAARLNPTLLTLFIGNNDVLGYAASGGTDSITAVLEFRQTGRIAPTSPQRFAATFAALMDSVIAKCPNAKIVVGNIPDVTAAPYFTTAGPGVRAALQNTLASLPAALQAGLRVALPNFPNGLPLLSSATPGGVRRLTDKDLFVLTANAPLTAFLTQLLGQIGANPAQAFQIIMQNPIPNGIVLDEDEQRVVQETVAAYNTAISAAIAKYPATRVTLFDSYRVVENVRQNGYPITGQSATPTGAVVGNVLRFNYLSGGFFSLDGIHPSSRGYAAVANEMIRTINRAFGANIPYTSIQDVPGLPIGTPQ
jgi:lysophospholipase L1-like esterase